MSLIAKCLLLVAESTFWFGVDTISFSSAGWTVILTFDQDINDKALCKEIQAIAIKMDRLATRTLQTDSNRNFSEGG